MDPNKDAGGQGRKGRETNDEISLRTFIEGGRKEGRAGTG
jgi:hypothetical protein